MFLRAPAASTRPSSDVPLGAKVRYAVISCVPFKERRTYQHSALPPVERSRIDGQKRPVRQPRPLAPGACAEPGPTELGIRLQRR